MIQGPDALQRKQVVSSEEVFELESELSAIAESRIDAWLSILTQALRLRESERRSIREELHEHIEERVHDLLVSGRGESDAVGQAIAELGDAVELANRFGKANQQARYRRITMNFVMLGIGVGTMALGTMMFSPQDSNIATTIFQEDMEASTSIAVADNQRLSIDEDTDLAELLDMIDQVTEQKVIAHWVRLEDYDITQDTLLQVRLSDLKIQDMMDSVSNLLSVHATIGWRVSDTMIELGPQESFDQLDLKLVAYSVNDILVENARKRRCDVEESSDALRDLLYSVVSPVDWRDNGGSLAELRIVGGKMFVEAPPRMHEKIRWILDQFEVEDPDIAMVDAWGSPITDESGVPIGQFGGTGNVRFGPGAGDGNVRFGPGAGGGNVRFGPGAAGGGGKAGVGGIGSAVGGGRVNGSIVMGVGQGRSSGSGRGSSNRGSDGGSRINGHTASGGSGGKIRD